MDWRFRISKRLNRKYLYGLAWDWRSSLEASGSEDFNESTILKRGNIFIDCGASYGFWSLRAYSFYNQVHAFEPDRFTYRILWSNLKINGTTNVSAYNIALGARVEDRDFYEQGNSESSLLPTYMGKGATGNKIRVKTRSLDSLGLSASVIKIDVEGAELEVLEGAKKTIETFLPTLLVEVHDPVTVEQVQTKVPSYEWETRWRYLNPESYRSGKQPHLKGHFAE